jgi:hypothetical protein
MYFDGQRHGLVNVGEILPDSRFYLLRTRDNARHKRSIRYNRPVFRIRICIESGSVFIESGSGSSILG